MPQSVGVTSPILMSLHRHPSLGSDYLYSKFKVKDFKATVEVWMVSIATGRRQPEAVEETVHTITSTNHNVIQVPGC